MIGNLLLPLGLAFIMFAIGLTLQVADFVRVFNQSRTILFGLFCQIILLPIMAFLLLNIWQIDPALAVGVMILAASPGGITSNLLTQFVKGDTALSVSLTSIASLLAMFTLPLIVFFSFNYFSNLQAPAEIPVWRMALGVFVVSTLPMMLGLALNHWKSKLAEKIETIIRPLSVLTFAAIVIAAFYSQWSSMMTNLPVIALPLLILNLSIMTIGYFGTIALQLGSSSARAIALEGGLQNGAMGIFVATTIIGNTALAVPSITYALLMNFTALSFILIRQFASRSPITG